MRPILLNSCARAATAAEARYRIDAPIAPNRRTRVVALDPGAAPVVSRLAAQQWSDARFLHCDAPAHPGDGDGDGGVVLRAMDGSRSRLADELDGAGVAVMVATANTAAAAAAAIGRACTVRGIMTAGLVLGSDHQADAAVSALRPHARVLLVTGDDHDVAELLTALRA